MAGDLRELLEELNRKKGRGGAVEQLADAIARKVYLKVRRLMKKQLDEIHDLEDDD